MTKLEDICLKTGINYNKLPKRLRGALEKLVNAGFQKEVEIILEEYKKTIQELLKYIEKEEYYGLPGAYIYININPP